MKNTIRTKVFATVIAAVCAASAISAVSIVSAYSDSSSSKAASASGEATIIERSNGSTAVVPMKGEDWNYYADSLYALIGCDYDYSNNICKFKFTAVKPGTTNAVLKTQRTDGKWSNTPVRIKVYDNLTMNITQTGNAYITNKSYTEETSKPAEEKKAETPKQNNTATASSSKGKTATFTLKGEDWTYFIDSLNISVSCDYDYSTGSCVFKLTAVKPGVTNAVLKTQRTDGKWNNTPLRVTVSSNLNVTVEQSGSTYVTPHSYTE